jgi:Spy/CpxP family protein refolding chaperone
MRFPYLTGLALVAALAFAACATAPTSGVQAADVPPADDRASVELREHHWHQHRGGVAQFIAMSLDTLGADDAKAPQIEMLQGELQACMARSGGRQEKLHLLLADGIAAGVIDAPQVDATIAQMTVAAAEVHDCSAGALNRLHAILSPVERAELVEKVQAHWEVWRHVNHDEQADGREPGGRLARLGEELSLAPDQIDRMSSALHTALAGLSGRYERNKVEAHVQAFAAAFPRDSFDAKSITPNANAQFVSHGATQMAIFYETVTPLLTPEQRAMLADHLRKHAGQQPAISAK